MKTQLLLLIPAALLIALFTPSVCEAQTDLKFTLDTPTTTAGTSSADQVFTFDGTLTNNTAAPLYLNGDLFSVDAPLSGDDTAFYNTFVFPTDSSGNALPQVPLAAGQTLDVALFTVTVPTGTALGTYSGLFQIQGGSSDSDYNVLAPAQTFTITTNSTPVMPVPEAPSSVTFSIGMLLTASIMVIARRKKVRSF